MTTFLAHQDAYLKECEATVLDVNSEDGYVALDQTVFFPGGNMDEPNGRMDFEFETPRGERVHEIEAKINLEVAA